MMHMRYIGCCTSGESIRFYSDDLINIETVEELTVTDDKQTISLYEQSEQVNIEFSREDIPIIESSDVTITDDEDIICGH